MTSWKMKSRCVAEPLNKVNSIYEKGTPSGTKKVPRDTLSVQTETPLRKPKSRANVHKSSEQFAAQKRQRNARYNKNLKERKHCWNSKNPNFVYQEKSVNPNVKISSPAKPKNFQQTQS